ncbi:MAG: hypothetical protein RLN90_09530 [Balneolaceae bacterium]
MDPTYRIYYGKYPDACTNEILNSDIRELNLPSFRIEPGKPGEPKVDKGSFTLENFDSDGNQKYPTSWFESQSRSVAEGATIPFQLFFKIAVEITGMEYIGVFSGKKPDKWNATVQVTFKSLIEFLLDSNATMLKEFSFEQLKQVPVSNTSVDNYTLVDGLDLEGNAISLSKIRLGVQATITPIYETEAEMLQDPEVQKILTNEFLDHLGIADINSWTYTVGVTEEYFESPRSVFINIGDQLIFTIIEIFKGTLYGTNGSDQHSLLINWGLNIWHADNSNIEEDEYTVLQRGRFFKDKSGTDFTIDDLIDVSIFDYNIGFDEDILLHNDDHNFLGFNHVHGIRYAGSGLPDIDFQLSDPLVDVSHIDILSVTTLSIEKRLFYSFYLDNENDPSVFELSNAGNFKYVFFSDISQYSWLDNSIGDILVNLAMQTNSYLFVNEKGKIVYQDRLLHESYLPGALPPGAFEIKIEDITPLGNEEDDQGFESYSISYNDRLEINNTSSETTYKKNVSKDGILTKPSLRNSSITLGNYRSSNLGVPGSNDHPDLPVFRYSPEHDSFPGDLDLSDFIPDPITQTQNFAKSFSYPTFIWSIEVSIDKYPTASIGGYFWTVKDGINKCYLIKESHPNPDRYMIGLKAQYVGEYTP